MKMKKKLKPVTVPSLQDLLTHGKKGAIIETVVVPSLLKGFSLTGLGMFVLPVYNAITQPLDKIK